MELPLIPFTSMFRIKGHVAVNFYFFSFFFFLQRFIPQAWEKLKGALKTYTMILGWFFHQSKGHAWNYWKEGFVMTSISLNWWQVLVNKKNAKFEWFEMEDVTSSIEKSTIKNEININDSFKWRQCEHVCFGSGSNVTHKKYWVFPLVNSTMFLLKWDKVH